MDIETDNPSPESAARQRLERLRSGSVLLSRENLKDPNFEATVVVVCVHNNEGSYGLVLNRPSHMPLSEIFSGFNGIDAKKKIFIGGPVRQEELQILHITDAPAEGAYEIFPRVFLGGRWDGLEPVIENDGNSLRLFLGYSGWGPGQLQYEILAGAWDVFTVDLEKLLAGPEEKLLTGVDNLEKYLRSLEPAPLSDETGAGPKTP